MFSFHLTLICLLQTAPSTVSQHVIFENIGQMAGALSYQHARLTLNLSSIFSQYESYQNSLETLYLNLSQVPPIKIQHNSDFKVGVGIIIRDSQRLNLETIQLHRNEAQDIGEQIETMRLILPEVAAHGSSDPIQLRTGRSTDLKMKLKKTSRIIKGAKIVGKVVSSLIGGTSSGFMNLLGLPFGIFGTFMGLYNKAQIDQVRRELYKTINAHNRLVEISQQQDEHIQLLDEQLLDLASVLHLVILQNPGYTSARLSRIESQLKARIHIAIHTIQQAQHRRLAVDFLSAEQLNILFIKLQEQAVLNGCHLLIHQRSDLFQLETSYFFDGADIHLLLHVPMVPNDSLLRLFKLHPFPLPLSGSHVFIPNVKDDILALSSGFQRYSAQLSATDLLGCHVVNNIYLCERHGVLNSNLNITCLGSLYMQDFDGVKKSCPLEIHKAGEIVHQLLNNWYLVYSPTSQTVPISCHNGTQSERHLSKGTSRMYVSPGCRAHLSSHLVISDISVKLETDLLHFEWRWDEVSMDGLQADVIAPQLALLEEHGLHHPTLSDLYEFNLHQKTSPSWWTVLVNFIGNLVMFVLFSSLTIFIIVRFIRYRKAKRAKSENNPENENQVI